jgi:sphingomyelin phosphodiesterase 2
MSIIREHAGLTDSWEVTHPNIDASQVTDALQALQQLGLTADSPLNTWSAGKSEARGILGKRLDYVLYRQPEQRGQDHPLSFIRVIDIKTVFTEHVPGHNYSFSDHFGLEAILEVVSATSQPSPPSSELSDATTTTVVQTLGNCFRNSRTRSNKELGVFGASLFFILAVAIGTPWVPDPWTTPIFIILTAIISWLGTTMLYEGFIYGNWERRVLTTVIEDLEAYKKGREHLRNVR